MAFDHAAYLILENAERAAATAYTAARRAAARKNPRPGAAAAAAAALETLRAAGAARFNFEMAGATIVDIATLEPAAWATARR